MKSCRCVLFTIPLLFFLLPVQGIHSQPVSFVVEANETEVLATFTITNTSGKPPEGGYFSFIIQSCAFNCADSILCEMHTTDPDYILSGYFWQEGEIIIDLVAITQEGDTLEERHSETILVIALPATPSDSCPDTAVFTCADSNLVCNGTFEWMADTLWFLDQLEYAYPWRGASTDLFSTVVNGQFGSYIHVPDNLFGYQNAHNGNAYAGLGGGLQASGFDFEVAQAPLKAPLKKGQRYAVEYYTSKADSQPYSCEGAQVFFMEDELNVSSWSQLISQVNTSWVVNALQDSIITDTASWIRFYDVFIPDTNILEWIGLGQVQQPGQIGYSSDTSIPDPWHGAVYFYYYYDDIAVYPLPPDVTLMDTVKAIACDSVVLKVTGTGAGTYQWSTSATADSIIVYPAISTQYFVTVWDPEGCDSIILSSWVIITDTTQSTPQIIGHNNDCDSVTSYWLDGAINGYYYVWQVSSGDGIFTSTGTNIDTLGSSDIALVAWTNMPQLPSHATLTVYIYNKCWVFQDSVRLNVFECCSPDAVHSFVNDTISDDTVFSASGGYFIIGTLVIDANVLFLLPPNDNAIFMGPEARIMVRTDGKELRMDSVRLLAGCDYMWDGIYLNDTTKVFSATASSFSDAYNAIVADSGAALEIMDCQFFDNLRSIVISSFPYSYKASVDQSGHYWPLEIYGTEFWQQGYPDQDLPYPPYSSFSSISAIELHNADTILIGKLDSARNYFHDLPQAILVHNSASRVINNQFTQILPDEEQYPPLGAVHVYQDDDPWDIDVFSTIGTGDPTGRNYFDSCMHAITFRENPLRIDANDISDCWYGVHGINPKKLTTIVSNTFDQPSTAGLGGLTAITLANVTVSAKGLTLRVDSNEISGFTKGIWGTNLDKTIPGKIQFAQNTILFGVLTYGVTGIKLDNCDGSMVQANNIACITRPDSGFTVGSHNGIWVNSTGGATILSNNLLRMGHGIYTTGSDLVTYFVCNHLDSCYYGFHFGESTALSDQGIYGDYNTLNRWMGDYSQYGCSFWGRIMRSSNGITNGPIDWYYLNQFSIFDPGSEHCGSHPMTGYIDEIENNGAQADCDMDTTVYDPFDIAAPEERERLLGGIVRDWYAYDTLEASFQSSEQDLFFKITKDDPGLLFLGDSSDHTYIQYYNSLSSTSIPETYQVFSFIESGDLQAAGSLNDALADSTEWQHSRKMTNAIYINSWCKGSFMFASSDHDSLLNIAHRSPYEYGDGVFTARVLLGLDSDKVPLPARVPVASEEPIESGIRFYPNPASDRVCYNQNKEYATVSELSIEIFDLMGRLIYTFSETSAIGEHCLRLVYRTNPGVYIARINAGSNHLGTGKIIIK